MAALSVPADCIAKVRFAGTVRVPSIVGSVVQPASNNARNPRLVFLIVSPLREPIHSLTSSLALLPLCSPFRRATRLARSASNQCQVLGGAVLRGRHYRVGTLLRLVASEPIQKVFAHLRTLQVVRIGQQFREFATRRDNPLDLCALISSIGQFVLSMRDKVREDTRQPMQAALVLQVSRETGFFHRRRCRRPEAEILKKLRQFLE